MSALPADPAGLRSTREAYRDALLRLMACHETMVCLDSDTGLFNGADMGASRSRYFNLGIAEQNLMGVAAGLAKSGRMPFVNTMATFATTRALEAIKIDIAYNDLPVRIAATHSGLAAGHLGPTHHSLEDLAVMRILPNMTVLVPADAAQAEQFVEQSLDIPGPVYLRLGRGATPAVDTAGCPPAAVAVRCGHAQLLRRGGDVAIVACGPYPVQAALEAAGLLAGLGVSAAVLNMHTVKPLDIDALAELTTQACCIVTVEEHWSAGGLGSAVAEALCDRAIRVLRVGVPDTFVAVAGTQRQLLDLAGVTAQAIIGKVTQALGLAGDPVMA